MFIDVINVKIRDGQVANRPIYVALAVTADGERDILGLWAGEHGDGEGAKYWLRVLTEIKNRGTARCAHGGLRRPEGPARRDRPGLAAGDHPDVHRAPAAQQLPLRQQARLGGHRQRPQAGLHRRRPRPPPWTRSPSSAAPGRRSTRRSSGSGRTPGPSSCRSWPSTARSARIICTTNAIESLNARFRRSVKARGHFPTEQAALKHLYLVIISLDPTGRGTPALEQPVESRPERLRHHLRRTPQRGQEVTKKIKLHR